MSAESNTIKLYGSVVSKRDIITNAKGRQLAMTPNVKKDSSGFLFIAISPVSSAVQGMHTVR